MRIMHRRQGTVHGVEHALILLRAGDRQDVGIFLLELLRLCAHAAGDDDLAVLRHGLADGAERFLLGAVEKAAGIDDDDVRAVVLARELIPLRAQARDDALGIHQRLGTPKRHETDFRRNGLIHLVVRRSAGAIPDLLSTLGFWVGMGWRWSRADAAFAGMSLDRAAHFLCAA